MVNLFYQRSLFAAQQPLIGLFQYNDVEVANINTFSPLEKRPNIDNHTAFNEEKVNKIFIEQPADPDARSQYK